MRERSWGQALSVAVGTAVGGFSAFVAALRIEDLLDARLPGWYFSDLLVYVLLPMFYFLAAFAGAVLLGFVVDYLYLRFAQAEAPRTAVRNDTVLVLAGGIGATVGGLIGQLSAFWVFGILLDSLVSPFLLVGGFLGALLLCLACAANAQAMRTSILLFGVYAASCVALYFIWVSTAHTGVWRWLPLNPLLSILLIGAPIVTFVIYRLLVLRRRNRVKPA